MTAPRESRRGLTLIELLVALAITSVAGLAVAVVTTSVARAMTSMNEARSALQRAHAAHARLKAYLDPALAVLDFTDDQGFALWLHDDRPGGRVNLSELRVFWFGPDTHGEISVEWVEFPDSWTPDELAVADIELTAVDDYYLIMETQRDLGYTKSAVLADGVDSLALVGAGIDLVGSDRVRATLGVAVADDESEELLLVFGLVNHETPG